MIHIELRYDFSYLPMGNHFFETINVIVHKLRFNKPPVKSRFPGEDITSMLEYVMGKKRTPDEVEDDVIPDTCEKIVDWFGAGLGLV